MVERHHPSRSRYPPRRRAWRRWWWSRSRKGVRVARGAGPEGRGVGTTTRSVAAYVRGRPLLADCLLAIAVYAGTIALAATLPAQFWPANVLAALVWGAVGLAGVAVRRRWIWLAVAAVAA